MTQARKVASYAEVNQAEYCYYKAESEHGGPVDTWYLWIPNVGLANLHSHRVVEHEDGTITASPSILVSTYGTEERRVAHGFLERGAWSDC